MSTSLSQVFGMSEDISKKDADRIKDPKSLHKFMQDVGDTLGYVLPIASNAADQVLSKSPDEKEEIEASIDNSQGFIKAVDLASDQLGSKLNQIQKDWDRENTVLGKAGAAVGDAGKAALGAAGKAAGAVGDVGKAAAGAVGKAAGAAGAAAGKVAGAVGGAGKAAAGAAGKAAGALGSAFKSGYQSGKGKNEPAAPVAGGVGGPHATGNDTGQFKVKSQADWQKEIDAALKKGDTEEASALQRRKDLAAKFDAYDTQSGSKKDTLHGVKPGSTGTQAHLPAVKEPEKKGAEKSKEDPQASLGTRVFKNPNFPAGAALGYHAAKYGDDEAGPNQAPDMGAEDAPWNIDPLGKTMAGPNPWLQAQKGADNVAHAVTSTKPKDAGKGARAHVSEPLSQHPGKQDTDVSKGGSTLPKPAQGHVPPGKSTLPAVPPKGPSVSNLPAPASLPKKSDAPLVLPGDPSSDEHEFDGPQSSLKPGDLRAVRHPVAPPGKRDKDQGTGLRLNPSNNSQDEPQSGFHAADAAVKAGALGKDKDQGTSTRSMRAPLPSAGDVPVEPRSNPKPTSGPATVSMKSPAWLAAQQGADALEPQTGDMQAALQGKKPEEPKKDEPKSSNQPEIPPAGDPLAALQQAVDTKKGGEAPKKSAADKSTERKKAAEEKAAARQKAKEEKEAAKKKAAEEKAKGKPERDAAESRRKALDTVRRGSSSNPNVSRAIGNTAKKIKKNL